MSTANEQRYKILGAIHRGGMGQILLARVEGAEGFSRKLVLKGLLPQLTFDEVSVDLFKREAQIMARLEHPNIVRVVDFTYVDDKPYLAMEYVRGRNFHQVIQRALRLKQRLPVNIVAYVLAEALRGLHYAHHARDEQGRPLGIIHRDISPGNILLSFFGEVKVADFGIALLADSKKYTAPKSIRGKARYAAPEIVRGKPALTQSDVHSAGVVLSEALLCAPLWPRGPNVSQTLMAIVSEPRDQTVDRVFAELREHTKLKSITRRALSLDPAQRQATAQEFADELDEVCREAGGATQTSLGEFLRQLFGGDADLPKDGGMIDSHLPALSFCRDAAFETEPSAASIADEEATPVQRVRASANQAPTAIDRPSNIVDSKPTSATADPSSQSPKAASPEAKHIARQPTQMVRERKKMPRPQTRPPKPATTRDTLPSPPPASVVAPRERYEVDSSEAYLFSELVRRETYEESSRSLPEDPFRAPGPRGLKRALRSPWVLLMIGILIGAATALTGSLLALMQSG